MTRSIASLFAALAVAACGARPPAPGPVPLRPDAPVPALEVRVDPRVELAAVLSRLAGFDEYQVAGIPAYDRALEAHFRPFADHPSVVELRRLREEKGVAYNATVEAALLAAPGTWTPRVALEPLPPSLDRRWDAASVRAFLAAAARFDSATGAAAFFAAQDSLYRSMETQLAEGLRGRVDIAWFARRFGLPERSRFIVIPGLQHGPHNYGIHLALPDGSVEYFQVIGTPTADGQGRVQYPMDAVQGLLVHEMTHPFVNPWVDAHARRLRPGGNALFQAQRERMEANAYGRWEFTAYETLVRAHVLRYFLDHGDTALYRRSLRSDRAQGFLWTDELADALQVDSAAPLRSAAAEGAVFSFFDGWTADAPGRLAARTAALQEEEAAARMRGPQLRLVPADGELVAAGPAVLELHFDRPMATAASILGDVPEVTGRPAWDDERRVLRIPVTLRAGATYVMQLNDADRPSAGFRSAAGEPLHPRTWTLRVRPAAGEPDVRR
ncbi:MAG TPA: DUF4932 domain-containing protein [Longimicrobium sp.]